MLDPSGAVAVITGAAAGIGECVAKHWARHGGKVVIADMAQEGLARVEAEIRAMGAEVTAMHCDVTREEDNHTLAQLAVDVYGVINLVVPCAAILNDGLLLTINKDTGTVTGKMPLEQFTSVIDSNLTSVFLTVRECAEQMINLGHKGLLCLVSSTSALGAPGQINYSSTKAAVAVIPKILTAEFFRRDVAHRIRCVAIAPGYVDTRMVKSIPPMVLTRLVEQVPIKRLIEPEEVASLVMELYRNEALAGEVYFIHGGLRLGSKG
jgi:3-oxoacyl-[acyl-carrier protein] reductase